MNQPPPRRNAAGTLARFVIDPFGMSTTVGIQSSEPKTEPKTIDRHDQAIGAEVCAGLLHNPAFGAFSVFFNGTVHRGRWICLAPEGEEGWIRVEVVRGVVRLFGEVPSLRQKCLAGALARQVQGCRGVFTDGIAVDHICSGPIPSSLARAVRLGELDPEPFGRAGRNAVHGLGRVIGDGDEIEIVRVDQSSTKHALAKLR